MRKRLLQLEEAGTPIKVAIIGCGRFGTQMITQIMRVPGMNVAVACDVKVQRAVDALGEAGHDTDAIITADHASKINDAIRRRMPAVTDDAEVAIGADVDVVVEGTGDPDAGARYAFKAIMEEKHVVMVNVEADVLVGPVLKRLADRAGVVYSLAYGDQPALIEELFDWSASLGFETVAAGKGTKFIPEYRKGTPEDALLRHGLTPEEAANSDLNPVMYNSFLDGTKSSIEMCAVANMTGLRPDVPGMHQLPAGIEEIPSLLIPAEDGGILTRKGVVDVVSCLRPDGSTIPYTRWIVFVVVTSDSPYLLRCLRDYGVPMNPSGRYGLVYRPLHLVGMEAPVSIAKAVLYGEPTGAPTEHVADVVATARRRLEVGEVLDGEGGYTAYGMLVEATQDSTEGLLPIGLSHGAKLIRPVDEDQMLKYSDVALPEGGWALHLRRLQRDSR